MGRELLGAMARVIQRVLGGRLRGGRGWREVAADWAELAGLPLGLHGPLGEEWEGGRKGDACAGCGWVQGQVAGQRHCRRMVQRLLEESGESALETVCDAGLVELAVPVRAGGQTIGFLVSGGFRLEGDERARLNRARHLLARAGVAVEAGGVVLP